MLEDWLVEFLAAIGKFFIHPLLFLFVIVTFLHGYSRLKKERKSFHTSVQDVFEEMRFTYSKGILAGLIVSVLFMLIGLSLPFGFVVLLAIVTGILGFMINARWLSPVYTIGSTVILAVVFQQLSSGSAASFFIDLEKINFAAVALFLSVIMIAEGIIIFRTAHLKTSPVLKRSSRGLSIGNHIANRTWMLPLFFLVPGGSLSSQLSWWPMLTLNGDSFMIFCIPFFLGFSQRIQGSLPEESIKATAKRVASLGVVMLIIAAASIWYTPLAFAVIIAAFIGREVITMKQRINDHSAAFFFSKRDKGLLILGILPQSPAEKLQLKVGELITKINGIQVKTVAEFYEALQKNRAFCKLEVIDLKGEIRFEQRALYDGEHHELGILFVADEKKWETETGSIEVEDNKGQAL
ncbi:PDZ domain-containing protein [Metabacillus fastidiosus]|uniref:PDZ domain-containing protein n=1 Tax=Metabacillus fastidiosus TaxID=1458 RepID=UPI002E247AD6|nr:PDZ domain-containing protein [Metabacillus fastidiosus]